MRSITLSLVKLTDYEIINLVHHTIEVSAAVALSALNDKKDLISLLNFKDKGLISIFGAGGKTSLMFTLAEQLVKKGQTVLTTTTTKIFFPTREQCQVTLINSNVDSLIKQLADRTSSTPHLSAGSLYDNDKAKITGFSLDQVDMIYQSGCFDWIIVEADGSRRKPLKSTNDTEPVFPKKTTQMILTTGLDAAGVVLQDSHVHRAPIFSERTGTCLGTPVTALAIAKNLSFEISKAQKICPGIKVCLFLNKADTQIDLKNAEKIANGLKASHPGLDVITGCLKPQPLVKNHQIL